MTLRCILATAFIYITLCPASAHALGWGVVKNKDEFTGVTTCRIMEGSEFSRAVIGGMLHRPILYLWFFEKKGDDIRVGVTTDYKVPISEDIQLKVDDQPIITITAVDTPLDSAPSAPGVDMSHFTPEMRANFDQSMHAIYALRSPYRALGGARADALVAQIRSAKSVKWRFVAVNATTDKAAEIPLRGLDAALTKCGI